MFLKIQKWESLLKVVYLKRSVSTIELRQIINKLLLIVT